MCKKYSAFDELPKYTKGFLEKAAAITALTKAHYNMGSQEKRGDTTLNYKLK